MSTLPKTTNVPDKDPDIILSKPILKMIILGDHPGVAKKASNFSRRKKAGVDRHVIWFETPSDTEIKRLFSGFDKDIDNVVAFSVSTKNKIADYILNGEIIDNVRVDQSFTKAGLPEFN